MKKDQIIRKLNDYYITCKLKYYQHLKMAEKYKSLYINTMPPIIILSSLTTVLASYNGSITDPALTIAVAIFSGLTTIAQALVAFFEFNTKYENHISASNKYITLSRMIEVEIYTNYYGQVDNIEQEKEYIKYLFEKIQKEMDTIQNTMPSIPVSLDKQNYNNVRFGAGELCQQLIDCDNETNSIETV